MSDPMLTELHANYDAHSLQMVGPTGADRMFTISRTGLFQGVWYPEGQRIRCVPGLHEGDLVVMQAVGRSDLRLGSLRGGILLGEGGERCSLLRWRVVGRAVPVRSPALGARGGEDGSRAAGAKRAQEGRMERRQLGLFSDSRVG